MLPGHGTMHRETGVVAAAVAMHLPDPFPRRLVLGSPHAFGVQTQSVEAGLEDSRNCVEATDRITGAAVLEKVESRLDVSDKIATDFDETSRFFRSRPFLHRRWTFLAT